MKTVVMTGGTSGLGEIAAQKLYSMPNTLLLLGAREGAQTQIERLPLDLTRLANVRAFVEALSVRLGDTEIDVLVFERWCAVWESQRADRRWI
jgi:NADP-dependent 3-hydroxy acid dehydrogenase YdfG